MIIQTNKAEYLISGLPERKDFISIKSNNRAELTRLFGSEKVIQSQEAQWRFEVYSCRQEFANSLILLVKEIDYIDFHELEKFI